MEGFVVDFEMRQVMKLFGKEVTGQALQIRKKRVTLAVEGLILAEWGEWEDVEQVPVQTMSLAQMQRYEIKG